MQHYPAVLLLALYCYCPYTSEMDKVMMMMTPSAKVAYEMRPRLRTKCERKSEGYVARSALCLLRPSFRLPHYACVIHVEQKVKHFVCTLYLWLIAVVFLLKEKPKTTAINSPHSHQAVCQMTYNSNIAEGPYFRSPGKKNTAYNCC